MDSKIIGEYMNQLEDVYNEWYPAPKRKKLLRRPKREKLAAQEFDNFFNEVSKVINDIPSLEMKKGILWFCKMNQVEKTGTANAEAQLVSFIIGAITILLSVLAILLSQYETVMLAFIIVMLLTTDMLLVCFLKNWRKPARKTAFYTFVISMLEDQICSEENVCSLYRKPKHRARKAQK